MGKDDILPPGRHSLDPKKEGVDAVSFALQKLQELLVWIDEHRSSFERHRNDNPLESANELSCLKDATYQAILRLQRLTELILAGYGIDQNMKISKDLCNVVWVRAVEAIQKLSR